MHERENKLSNDISNYKELKQSDAFRTRSNEKALQDEVIVLKAEINRITQNNHIQINNIQS